MRNASPVVRFWRQVCKSDGCWYWTGYVGSRRKGVIWVSGKPIYAPRFSYTTFVGPILEGMYVCHHCDNPLCVRPSHLFVGSQDDNMKDMVAKGRANKPQGEANGRAKLDDDAVRFIRANYKFRSKEFGQRQLAVRFGVCVLTIQEVLDGKKWGHVDQNIPSGRYTIQTKR